VGLQFRDLCRCVAVTSLVAGFWAGSRAGVVPPKHEAWGEVQSPHFVVIGSVDGYDLRRVLTELESFQIALTRLAPELPETASTPVEVYVFRDEASFRNYVDERGAAAKWVGGFFGSLYGRRVIALYGAADRDTFEVLFHEMTHDSVDRNLPGVPLWFNEGISDFYGSIRREKTKALLGLPIHGYVPLLKSEGLIPVATLFTLDRDSPEIGDPKRIYRFYAESWALVHYLTLGNPTRRPQLARYLESLRQGRPPHAGFIEAFGFDESKLDNELADYLQKQPLPTSTVEVGEIAVEVTNRTDFLPRADVLRRLGDLMVWSPMNATRAGELFDAAAKLAPHDATVIAGRGVVAFRHDHVALATSLLDRAIAGGDERGWTLTFAALAHLRSAESGMSEDGVEPIPSALSEQARQARDLALRATKLDPANGVAWSVVGETYFDASGDYEPGVRALERAIALQPRFTERSWALVRLHAVHGNRAAARAAFDRYIAAAASADDLQRFRMTLLRIDLEEARAKLDANANEEAVAILDHVRTALAGEDPQAERVRDLLKKTRELLAQIDRDRGPPPPPRCAVRTPRSLSPSARRFSFPSPT
jgi:hypothetical protein